MIGAVKYRTDRVIIGSCFATDRNAGTDKSADASFCCEHQRFIMGSRIGTDLCQSGRGHRSVILTVRDHKCIAYPGKTAANICGSNGTTVAAVADICAGATAALITCRKIAAPKTADSAAHTPEMSPRLSQ